MPYIVDQNPVPLPVTGTPKVALAKKQVRHSMCAHVDKALHDTVVAEAKKQKRSLREVVEWGMKEYLFNANPCAAAKLGIHAAAE